MSEEKASNTPTDEMLANFVASHAKDMRQRFTDRARKVMALANQEAQRLNNEYVGTEHILLGLVKEGTGIGVNVLRNFDIELRKVRLEVDMLVKPGPDVVTMGKLPQTQHAKKVIDFAIEEAQSLNHNYVGTEHLLLGMVREQDGIAGQVLRSLAVGVEAVRKEVLSIIGKDEIVTASPSAVTRDKQATPLETLLLSAGLPAHPNKLAGKWFVCNLKDDGLQHVSFFGSFTGAGCVLGNESMFLEVDMRLLRISGFQYNQIRGLIWNGTAWLLDVIRKDGTGWTHNVQIEL